jgi:hypothetical protein
MPDTGQRAIYYSNTNVIRIKKQKQFHKKFFYDTTFSFTKTDTKVEKHKLLHQNLTK